MSDDATYAADDSHPIPRVDICDVHAVRQGGGGELAVVIAAPMRSDLRSRQRLMRKLDSYLGFIASEEFAAECGAPTLQNTTISVHIHPDSDIEVFQLLERCHGWVEDNHARLMIKKRPNPERLEPTAPSGRGSS